MRVLTSDTFCGAYLMAKGAQFVRLLVDRTGTRDTGTFVFEGDGILELQEEYSRGVASASVKAIRDGVTFLRSRLARELRLPADRPTASSRSLNR